MAFGMLGLGWIAAQADANRRWHKEPKAAAVAVVDEIFAASLEPEEDLKELMHSSRQRASRSKGMEQQRLLSEETESSSRQLEDLENSRDESGALQSQSRAEALKNKDPEGSITDDGTGVLSSYLEG